MTDKVDRLLNGVYDTLHWAENCWEVWWLYVGEDTPPELRSILERFHAALEVPRFALFTTTIVNIGKLYDKRHGSVSIRRLIEAARASGRFQPVLLDALDAHLRKGEERAEPIKRIRNSRVAHDVLEPDERAILADASVAYSDVEEVLKISRTLVDSVSAALNVGFSLGHPADAHRKMWQSLLQESLTRHSRNQTGAMPS